MVDDGENGTDDVVQDSLDDHKTVECDEGIALVLINDVVIDASTHELKCDDRIQYLYGAQGRVAFCPDKSTTYVTAVRRLLSLGWRDECQYALIQYHAGPKYEVLQAGVPPRAVVKDVLPLQSSDPA